MSDQQPPATPKQRPRPAAPRRAGRPSAESRFVGYLVLGFGAVALAAVLILALSRNSPDAPATDQQVVDTITRDMSAALTPDPPAPEKPRKELEFPRQPDIDPSVLLGAWKTMIADYTVVLQIQNGTYQIILAGVGANASRLYSLGTYKILEDIILLTPRADWPQPAPPAGQSIRYDMLTQAPFPMVYGVYKGNLVWQNPPQSENRVIAPYRSPLLLDDNLNYIVWQKL